MLKEELRNMERMEKREGVDLTYLKNVILKLLETGTLFSTVPSSFTISHPASGFPNVSLAWGFRSLTQTTISFF